MSKRTLVFEDYESPISLEKYERTPEKDNYVDSPIFEGILKFIKKDSVQRFIEQNLSPPPKMYELTPNQNKKRKFEEQYQESLNLKETRLFLFLIQFL
jgi:hypothetical protein